jgi:hypothetical protein
MHAYKSYNELTSLHISNFSPLVAEERLHWFVASTYPAHCYWGIIMFWYDRGRGGDWEETSPVEIATI